jgi:hypothetical protein
MISTAAPLRAAEAICSRAFDELIKARAKRLVWGHLIRQDGEIPTAFWWARGRGALKQNWTTGDFETWIDQKLHCRAYGVEFLRDDIEAMLPAKAQKRTSVERFGPGNFAPAITARNELQRALGCNEQEVEQLVLRGCRAGVVSARCASISWRVTDRYGSEVFDDAQVSIPEWFWENCSDGPDTVLNWVSGRFAGRGFVDSDEYKVKIDGVEFEVGDIVDLEAMERRRDLNKEDASESNDEKQPQANSPSGRRLSEKWRPWIAELVAYIHENGVPDGVGSQGQEEVIQGVADALSVRAHDALGRSTVQPIVQAVLDRLRIAEK